MSLSEPPSPSSSSRSSLSKSSASASIKLCARSFVLILIPGFRLQDKSSTFAGPMDVLKTIVRKEGVLGLYAGMESTFWRHLWWNGGYFGAIFQVKALLPKPTVRPHGSVHLRWCSCYNAYRIKLPKCETTCCPAQWEVSSVQF